MQSLQPSHQSPITALKQAIVLQQEVTHQEHAAAAHGEGVVLQRRGPVVGVDDVAGLEVQGGHPPRELAGVGQRGRQEHHANLRMQFTMLKEVADRMVRTCTLSGAL